MIPLFKVVSDKTACLENLDKVIESGYVGQGDLVDRFEEKLQKIFKTNKKVLTVNSCTSALELALHLCGLGYMGTRKFVITTPQTCTATNSAILSRNGIILWADVDKYTGNIDPASVAKLVKSAGKNNVAAIMCVDWGGSAVNYDAIRAVAEGIPIIEDAAHSFLTYYKGSHIANTGGDYVCFSFQAIKHLHTGDGGAIIVPEGKEKRAELLRWYGLDRKSSASFRCSQTINEAGYKFHMNNIAAGIGLANIPSAILSVMGSKRNAAYYTDHIKTGNNVVYVPPHDPNSSFWIYTILVKNRDAFIQYMKSFDVDTSPVHARNDKHPCFPSRDSHVPQGELGIDFFSSHNVAIPCGDWVTEEERAKIVKLVNDWNDGTH